MWRAKCQLTHELLLIQIFRNIFHLRETEIEQMETKKFFSLSHPSLYEYLNLLRDSQPYCMLDHFNLQIAGVIIICMGCTLFDVGLSLWCILYYAWIRDFSMLKLLTLESEIHIQRYGTMNFIPPFITAEKYAEKCRQFAWYLIWDMIYIRQNKNEI